MEVFEKDVESDINGEAEAENIPENDLKMNFKRILKVKGV